MFEQRGLPLEHCSLLRRRSPGLLLFAMRCHENTKRQVNNLILYYLPATTRIVISHFHSPANRGMKRSNSKRKGSESNHNIQHILILDVGIAQERQRDNRPLYILRPRDGSPLPLHFTAFAKQLSPITAIMRCLLSQKVNPQSISISQIWWLHDLASL